MKTLSRDVCLIIAVLVSLEASAQSPSVTFAPGEFVKEVPVLVAPGQSQSVFWHAPDVICRWPSNYAWQQRIPLGSPSLITQKLNQMESIGNASARDIGRAMNVFLDVVIDGNSAAVSIPGSGSYIASYARVTSPGGDQHEISRGCFDSETGRRLLFDMRRVIRAYLGLPPPMAAPTKSELPAPTTQPATLPAPTGLGTPATIR